MSIIIFFVVLLVLVIVHEFGHFFSAKKFGIRVDEFGFGFPPKLFGIKKGETEYTFNLLPLGGFVKIFGENPNEENISGPDSTRSFVNKPKWQQAIVLSAGVFANFLLAWFLFSIGFMTGFPVPADPDQNDLIVRDVYLVLTSVMPNSPAEIAGLKPGDKIVFVKKDDKILGDSNGKVGVDDFKSLIATSQGQTLELKYLRGNNKIPTTALIAPKLNDDGKYLLGVSMGQIGTAKLSFFKAISEGLKLDLYMTKNTALGFYKLIKDALVGKGDLSSVTGPVGIVGMAGDAYEFGFSQLLSFAAMISINLAVLNLIPFPALDGGRLLFVLIEKIKGSRLNPKVSNYANLIGFSILIIFMIFITYKDIVRMF